MRRYEFPVEELLHRLDPHARGILREIASGDLDHAGAVIAHLVEEGMAAAALSEGDRPPRVTLSPDRKTIILEADPRLSDDVH